MFTDAAVPSVRVPQVMCNSVRYTPIHDHLMARLQLFVADLLCAVDGCGFIHQAVGGAYQLAARASLRDSGGAWVLPDVLVED